jgi:hypothetical protein
MKHEDFASFRRLPKSEQDAIDALGIKQWAEWLEINAAYIVDHGGMVGKTTRITKNGIADAANPLCGYLVIEAENAEAAAVLFQNHPHLTVFPGDGVDIMPLVT